MLEKLLLILINDDLFPKLKCLILEIGEFTFLNKTELSSFISSNGFILPSFRIPYVTNFVRNSNLDEI